MRESTSGLNHRSEQTIIDLEELFRVAELHQLTLAQSFRMTDTKINSTQATKSTIGIVQRIVFDFQSQQHHDKRRGRHEGNDE